MIKITAFGYCDLFNDIDVIADHKITKLVLNVEPKSRVSYTERISRTGRDIKVITLDDFAPESQELYIMGFHGIKSQQLINHLKASHNISFYSLISSDSTVWSSSIGEGVFLSSTVTTATYSKIGNFVKINRGVTIGHDTIIEDYAVIQPGVNIAGNVKIKKGALIGMGANIIEDITIGENSVVAAGAVVINDVPPNVMVAGVPAIMKKRL